MLRLKQSNNYIFINIRCYGKLTKNSLKIRKKVCNSEKVRGLQHTHTHMLRIHWILIFHRKRSLRIIFLSRIHRRKTAGARGRGREMRRRRRRIGGSKICLGILHLRNGFHRALGASTRRTAREEGP